MAYKKLQIRRGPKAQLPTLAEGELGYCTDTNQMFVGSGSGNTEIETKQVLTATLASGSTSLSFNNSAITTDSAVDVYTSIFGAVLNNIDITSGKAVLTFEPQSTSMNVRIEVHK
nr:MAG TPA: tail protein [Caudoviricetes sp.]